MKHRAVVFTLIALLLLLIVWGAAYLLPAESRPPWHVPLLISVALALLYAFFPVAESHALTLPIEVSLLALVLVDLIVACLAAILVLAGGSVFLAVLAVAAYAAPGVLLRGGGYLLGQALGASVGTIAYVALLLYTARRYWRWTYESITQYWRSSTNLLVRVAESLGAHEWISWTVFPVLLLERIWELAGNLGHHTGGDIVSIEATLGGTAVLPAEAFGHLGGANGVPVPRKDVGGHRSGLAAAFLSTLIIWLCLSPDSCLRIIGIVVAIVIAWVVIVTLLA